MSTLSANFKKYRKNLNLSQQDVADYLGVNRVEVSYYENGARNIPDRLALKFAELIGISPFELLQEYEFNLAFSTRNYKKEDSDEMLKFKRIVSNYFKLKRLSNTPKTHDSPHSHKP